MLWHAAKDIFERRAEDWLKSHAIRMIYFEWRPLMSIARGEESKVLFIPSICFVSVALYRSMDLPTLSTNIYNIYCIKL